MSDNDAATRRKATEYGGWVGDTILRLMEERDAARAAYAEALKQMAALQEVYIAVYTERDALREALTEMEAAVNQSVSGIRKPDMVEWIALLTQAQAAMFGSAGTPTAGYEQEGKSHAD